MSYHFVIHNFVLNIKKRIYIKVLLISMIRLKLIIHEVKSYILGIISYKQRTRNNTII